MSDKYRKRPVVVEVVRLDPTRVSIQEALEFMGSKVHINCNAAMDAFDSYCYKRIGDGFLGIDTLEGVMKASFGDYIIKGVKGECYPCKPDIFEMTYEPLPDAPRGEG